MEKFYDIYDFYFVPFWKTPLFTNLAIIVGLLLLLVFAYTGWRSFKNRNIKSLTIWEYAQRELHALNPKGLSSKNEFKKFYFDLSLVLKRYIGVRYNLDLEDKTDNEIEKYLTSKNFDNRLSKEFIGILQGSRFIKFAGENALPQRAMADWRLACDIVSRTIPQNATK